LTPLAFSAMALMGFLVLSVLIVIQIRRSSAVSQVS